MSSNMTMVYEIKYARDLSDDVTDVKFVGVFSTREKANEALEEVKKLPGFAQYPECLLVTEVEVDLDHWTYGFFTPNDLCAARCDIPSESSLVEPRRFGPGLSHFWGWNDESANRDASMRASRNTLGWAYRQPNVVLLRSSRRLRCRYKRPADDHRFKR